MNHAPHGIRQSLGLFVGLLLTACGPDLPPPTTPHARPPASQAPVLAFTDVTEQSGITFRNLTGYPDKPYITDCAGGGACLLDYDGDGDLDIFLANATAFPPGGAWSRL